MGITISTGKQKHYVNIKKKKNSRNLGFDDSSSGGRLNRLRIKKIQEGWDIQSNVAFLITTTTTTKNS